MKSNDLNDIQDALIQDYNDLRGVRTRSIRLMPGSIFQEPGSAGALTFSGAAGLYDATLSLSAGIGVVPIPFLKPGDRMLSVRIAYADSVVGAPTPILKYMRYGGPTGAAEYTAAFTYDPTGDGASTGFKIQRWIVTTPVAMWLYNPTPGTPSNLSWAMSAVLTLTASVNSTTIYGVEFDYDTQTPVEDT